MFHAYWETILSAMVQKDEAFSCPGNDVFASESERMNADILSTIQCSLCCCLAYIHFSIYEQC